MKDKPKYMVAEYNGTIKGFALGFTIGLILGALIVFGIQWA